MTSCSSFGNITSIKAHRESIDIHVYVHTYMRIKCPINGFVYLITSHKAHVCNIAITITIMLTMRWAIKKKITLPSLIGIASDIHTHTHTFIHSFVHSFAALLLLLIAQVVSQRPKIQLSGKYVVFAIFLLACSFIWPPYCVMMTKCSCC